MIILTNNTETDYFLPEDGDIAKSVFIELMKMPSECWVSSYGFNMCEAFTALADNEQANIPNHLLLDYTQSRGATALALIKAYIPKITKGDLTLTTAGIGSRHTSQIWHWKGFVKNDPSGGLPHCWDGSTNFSESGWFQGNSCRYFRSAEWAKYFIDQHNAHQAWARQKLPHYQVSALSSDPVDEYFHLIKNDLLLNEIRERLASQTVGAIDKGLYYAIEDKVVKHNPDPAADPRNVMINFFVQMIQAVTEDDNNAEDI